jgi:hypothetical protein
MVMWPHTRGQSITIARIIGVNHQCPAHIFFFKFVVLGFELRASHLLGRYFTT